MKLEDMTLKQVQEYCDNTECADCICSRQSSDCELGHRPYFWNLEGEVQNES